MVSQGHSLAYTCTYKHAQTETHIEKTCFKLDIDEFSFSVCRHRGDRSVWSSNGRDNNKQTNFCFTGFKVCISELLSVLTLITLNN